MTPYNLISTSESCTAEALSNLRVLIFICLRGLGAATAVPSRWLGRLPPPHTPPCWTLPSLTRAHGIICAKSPQADPAASHRQQQSHATRQPTALARAPRPSRSSPGSGSHAPDGKCGPHPLPAPAAASQQPTSGRHVLVQVATAIRAATPATAARQSHTRARHRQPAAR